MIFKILFLADFWNLAQLCGGSSISTELSHSLIPLGEALLAFLCLLVLFRFLPCALHELHESSVHYGRNGPILNQKLSLIHFPSNVWFNLQTKILLKFLPMLDAFDRIVSYFMVLVGKNWAKGPVYFWTKVRYYGQFVAHDTSSRCVRGGGGAAAEATSVVYRRSSLLSKQASTSSLPLRLSKFSAFTSVAGEKGAFHTKLGSLQ